MAATTGAHTARAACARMAMGEGAWHNWLFDTSCMYTVGAGGKGKGSHAPSPWTRVSILEGHAVQRAHS